MKNDYIVRKTYYSFVLVSILSSLTAAAGMLIDNIIVGRYLGSESLGAMGIVGPVSLVFSAIGISAPAVAVPVQPRLWAVVTGISSV